MKILNKILNYLIVVALVYIIVNAQLSASVSMSKSKSASASPKFDLNISLEDVNKYYEEADSISLEDVNFYYVFNDGKIIGTVMNTSPYSDEIYGYNSVTPLNIYLDSCDKIVEVEMCENRESRGFVNKVINSGFLDSWDGLTVEEAAKHHVDAVSGSTFSSHHRLGACATRPVPPQLSRPRPHHGNQRYATSRYPRPNESSRWHVDRRPCGHRWPTYRIRHRQSG